MEDAEAAKEVAHNGKKRAQLAGAGAGTFEHIAVAGAGCGGIFRRGSHTRRGGLLKMFGDL